MYFANMHAHAQGANSFFLKPKNCRLFSYNWITNREFPIV